MFTLGTYFEELLKNLRPPADRLELAKDLPDKVRDFLKEHPEFETVTPHTKLAGSYAQHTTVGDVKDVDFLVRVPGTPEENEPEAKRLIQDLKKTLDELPEALGYSGYAQMQDVEVERARRSIHVYFEGEDFHIDVVPCIAPDGFDEIIYVPDRGFNEWIPSHPIGLVKLLTDLNNQNGQKVRPLIKLVKHFRDIHMVYQKPKSYWILSLVIHHVRKDNGLDMSKSLAEIFHDFCDAVYKQYDHLLTISDTATPNIADPMLDHNVSWNWDRSHFETFMRRLDDGRKWSKKALEAEDRETAIEYWQKIFGDEYFPENVEAAAKNQAEIIWPGKSYVSSAGLNYSNRPEDGKSTYIPATTYHGEEEF
ncbi:nucleotidyltransferase [bacterium]|nr:nucleotidyltransferase [bacterium]